EGGACAAPASEDVLEDVLGFHEMGKAAARAVGVFLGAGPVEIAVVALARPFLPGRVDLAALVARAFLRIAENVVSRGDLFELFLRLLVPGIEVRMQLFRELPVGRANLLL